MYYIYQVYYQINRWAIESKVSTFGKSGYNKEMNKMVFLICYCVLIYYLLLSVIERIAAGYF